MYALYFLGQESRFRMAAKQGLGVGRLVCQRGRRITEPLLEVSPFTRWPIAGVRWRGKHQGSSQDLSPESQLSVSFLTSSNDSEGADEAGGERKWPVTQIDHEWLRLTQSRPVQHQFTSSTLDLPSSVRWFSSKPGPDAAALGPEFQGAVAEALKSEHGERIQKESSASEAAACDDAVSNLSEAQKKAKQKEAAKKYVYGSPCFFFKFCWRNLRFA